MCALTKVLESEFKWKVYITCFNSIKSTSAISRVYAIETHSALLLEFCVLNNKTKRKRQHISECKTKIFKWTKIYIYSNLWIPNSKQGEKSSDNKYTRKNAKPLAQIKVYTVYKLHSQIIIATLCIFRPHYIRVQRHFSCTKFMYTHKYIQMNGYGKGTRSCGGGFNLWPCIELGTLDDI